jgi:hypothetical protein
MQEPAGPTKAPAPPGVISWDLPPADKDLHWLPVRLPHGATAASNANDSSRIQLTIQVDPEDSEKVVTFLRGRELRGAPLRPLACMHVHPSAMGSQLMQRWCAGAKIALPDGYVCLALEQQPTQAKDSEDCEGGCQEGAKHWKAVHAFQSITLWGHDQVPAKGEPSQRCIDFLRLAQKVRGAAQSNWEGSLAREGNWVGQSA